MARPPRQRLDLLLVERGLASSRERAQALILAGSVVVGDHGATKPGLAVPVDVELRLKGEPMPFVSRGGLKLVCAVDRFALEIAGRDCLDVGASTGGFTDVLLQRGATRVVAVDVGHGQLAWKLRTDPRVTARDGCNVRHLTLADLPFAPEVVVADVSFISLTLVLPRLRELLEPRGLLLVCLVKPQFEVGKGAVGKGGVVRDPTLRLRALDKVIEEATGLGFDMVGWVESPITGPAGNVEYLLVLRPPTVAARAPQGAP